MDCESPGEICSSIKKWTLMRIQVDLRPKKIEALINGKNATEIGFAREALYTAGSKLLDEKTLSKELHCRHDVFPFTIQETDAFRYGEREAAREMRTPKNFIAYTAIDLHLRDPDALFGPATSRLTKDPVWVS
ncbi:uncharacterized protein F4807DRAFT_464839 [Annulohypoxylon truncatum]|uniref:uncharacterized protein n=1 Tax=Annulohypoxylon truncatum TaxID=327061 RepID=UPI0020075DC3|nr:uncharacterized protein F4807DRAFT_464839 [Annulohypoxylon truncatum]KAI1205363.1 hypothetical protein F4807DRAFT_464839 [Annulohypoxylon truncatum]